MRIAITDSGVGGLSVCAEVEATLRRNPVQENIELLYLNAALEDDYSYNSMTSRQEKIRTFDRFLDNILAGYQPDFLFIACNTLSVLFEDSHFDGHRQIPIQGIVDTGTREIIKAFRKDRNGSIIVFATETTIGENVYKRNLCESGIPADHIVQQACPGLADAISNDATGGLASDLLESYIPSALEQFRIPPDRVLAFLGCTHYGYQTDLFKNALQERVAEVRVLNPNPGAVNAILSSFSSLSGQGTLDIKFVTRYAIPEKPIDSLSGYIKDQAPATIVALQNFIHLPGLF